MSFMMIHLLLPDEVKTVHRIKDFTLVISLFICLIGRPVKGGDTLSVLFKE